MYAFDDLGGRHVALRPEQTASVCRAFVQHRPATPWKVWYAGTNFRYEKPQRGRYRQFDQVGIEVLGADDPYLDVEVIALGWEFYRRLGLRQVRLLRQLARRARRPCPLHRGARRALRRPTSTTLSEESRATLTKNPLRVLDSKRAQDAPVIAAAPVIAEFYSDAAAAHFAAVQDGLRRARHPLRRRRQARARPRLLPAHDVRVPGAHARLGAERARRRRSLRRSRRGARRPADARHRLRPRRRPHAAGVRRRGRVRRARRRRSTCSSSTRPAGSRRCA